MGKAYWVADPRAKGGRILVETLDKDDHPPSGRKQRAKRKPFTVDWVRLPNYWIERLKRCQRLPTIKLAHCILREDYKRQHLGGEIILSTRITGMARSSRFDAVQELVELRLIRTHQKGNGAVRVINLLLGNDRPKRRRGKNGK
jgi:hypothetical protein